MLTVTRARLPAAGWAPAARSGPQTRRRGALRGSLRAHAHAHRGRAQKGSGHGRIRRCARRVRKRASVKGRRGDRWATGLFGGGCGAAYQIITRIRQQAQLATMRVARTCAADAHGLHDTSALELVQHVLVLKRARLQRQGVCWGGGRRQDRRQMPYPEAALPTCHASTTNATPKWPHRQPPSNRRRTCALSLGLMQRT